MRPFGATGLVYPRGFSKPLRPVLDINHPLSRGLVGCWLLGDNPGLTTDISVNENSGSYSNSPTVVASHHGGMASSFNGTTQLVSIPNSAALNLTRFTVGAWAFVTGGAGGDRPLISKRNGAGDNRTYYLAARGANTWGFYFTTGANNYQGTDGTIAVASSVWQHVVATYDGATIRVFVDGVAGGTAATAGPPDATTVPVGIAGFPDGIVPVWFPGSIEGVRIYNRALSVAEILAWKAEPYAGICAAGTQFVLAYAAAATPPSGKIMRMPALGAG